MRNACLLAFAVFSLFTYWQFNDLEQYGTELWFLWVLGYAAVAVVSLISSRRRLPRAPLIGGSVTAFIFGLFRIRAVDWDGVIFYNETNPAGNETGGLMIVTIWLLVLAMARSSTGELSRGRVEQPGSLDR